jgi:hypothetical protein
MAITKRGKYFHYEFIIDGQRYRGSTKETVKSRAHTVEALKIADVRNNGANLNLRRHLSFEISPRASWLLWTRRRSQDIWTATPSFIITAGGRCSKGQSWRECASIR